MSYKENNNMGVTSSVPTPAIKPEPQEPHITPLAESTLRRNASDASSTLAQVKSEPKDAARVFQDRGLPVPPYAASVASGSGPTSTSTSNVTLSTKKPKSEDVEMEDAAKPLVTAPEEPKPRLYKVYQSATDIPYQPENALKEGLGMVKTLKSNVKTLELGSKLRKDVWLREIENLQAQGAPTTMIAVCGATGAGKSSLLNAILDDNIVPTSGMRACTAVVTEIAYHLKRTIDADVSFLSEAEWRQELEVLLDDLIDEDGNVKRSTDMRSDAGVAWSKVHAVYPSLTQEQLAHMNADQIIAKDQKIAKLLGTTKNIVAKDSKIFAQEIAKYIDSKDQKRGSKKDKKDKKDKSKPHESSFADLFSKEKQAAAQKVDKEKKDEAALWPLIRQVNVRCPSAVLSTGAVLVDLPGVADANAARNSIAKDYMKKCACIFIVASVHRAVDDKAARDLLGDAFRMQLMMDGNYDAHAITFIASKCDDISCSEVIRALQLEEDPELEEIEERIDQYKEETSEWKQKKAAAERNAKAIDAQLKEIRAYVKEYDAHLDALKKGETFTPILTGKATKRSKKTNVKKRKREGDSGKNVSPKRRKGATSDVEDEEMLGSDDDDVMDDIESDIDSEKSDDEDDSNDESDESDASGSNSGSEASSSDDDNNEDDETEESLKAKIVDAKAAIKTGRERLNEARKEKKDAIDGLAGLKKKETKVQKEKNAFCSLKRSEFSRDVLKEDFRVGLKDLDDAAAEERDPDSFNPNVNIRNYEEIDLPVFTCSARDYVRLKGQVKGDGDAACFSDAKDTDVPALQEWCHKLTVSSRERAARNFLTHLKTFANSIKGYVQGIGDVTVADRTLLREKWESSVTNEDDGMDHGAYGGWGDSSTPSDSSDLLDLPGFANLANGMGAGLYSLNKAAPKVDPYGEPVGVTPRLTKDFGQVVNDSVRDLQKSFRDGLEDKCRTGAANAADAAVITTDTFAASMHWASFRATLRRHGEYRRDLNVELVNPFTRNIASSWQQVFEGDLFNAFETAALNSINKLVKEVEDSAAAGLKDRVKTQAEMCVEEARVALKKTVDLVGTALQNEQKEVSRCLAPHVRDQLVDGYDLAMEERGTGSVARQKAVFHTYISNQKDDIFEDGAEVLMERLDKSAEAIGAALDAALTELAQKIEVNLSVLWEGPRDHPDQVRARNETVEKVTEILGQVDLWTQAEQLRAKD